MKKIKLLALILAFFNCLSFFGCKKFLDEKSDAKLIVPKSMTDLQGILDDATSMNLKKTPAYGENLSDDFFLLPTTVAPLPVVLGDVYIWKKIDYRFGNDWSDGYLPIYNSNLCLEILNDIPRNTQNATQWDNIKGSALFYRSYYFYLLTTQYGLAYDDATSGRDLGVVLRLSSDFNIKGKRATVKECMDKVVSDLLEAIPLLPNFPENKLRPSRSATFALLSRAYLYMGNYALAGKYADECIKLTSDLMNFNGDADVLGLDLPVTFKRFNKETIFYSEMGFSFDLHRTSIAKIDTVLYASYNNNDLRKRAYFGTIGLYKRFKGSYSSSSTSFFSGLATDEMYLNRAEAKAFLEDVTGAMQDLNFLLKTRWNSSVAYIPITATDRNDALDKIRKERRKELIMRNLRWADIKRYNKEGAGIQLKRISNGMTYILEPNSPFYALPLPTDLIEEGLIDN